MFLFIYIFMSIVVSYSYVTVNNVIFGNYILIVQIMCCSMCLTDLYVKLLNHNIAHVTYDAEIAGLRFACFHSLYLTYSYILAPDR